ncbi:ribonuclease Z [Sulfurifustis variabilis]|uniref:Ribonuclease Z n=1 Tax=Sulfurifustis variabilis TaxID=1675686 RepID=A0A1B4VBA0_9GAMM|nr:ribonuclease Z [Sulfurifustis variabilis]BAU47711.1 ribonuclease Z [Sulfurifustis variabilis]
MRPLFHPQLVNDAFGDPGLYVEFMFERRALLFDLGDLGGLSTRRVLRVTDVFVSHAHMDHFIGFDYLLRLHLGRGKRLRLYGPPGFAAQVGHKLAAYTWNLVHRYEAQLVFEVLEVHPDGNAFVREFSSSSAFRHANERPFKLVDGVLFDEPALRVRTVFLEHGTSVLAFALEEKAHVNVWKNRLQEMGLPMGPWLHALKRAVLAGLPDETLVRVPGATARDLPLGMLREHLVRVVPGQKIAYIVDCDFSTANVRRIVSLARDADWLYVESPFLHEDVAHATRKHHLTTRQAGWLAREARAKRTVPFHFSPKYRDREAQLRSEVEESAAIGALT